MVTTPSAQQVQDVIYQGHRRKVLTVIVIVYPAESPKQDISECIHVDHDAPRLTRKTVPASINHDRLLQTRVMLEVAAE
jgi:hypothetical protein